MKEVVLDAILDALKAAPLVLAVYVVMELVERAAAGNAERKKFPSALTPLIGATVGLIPQCGFSVVAADAYSKRKLSAGALAAVFIATSDEAIPVLLGDLSAAPKLIPLLVIKYALAIALGYAVHFFLPSLSPNLAEPNERTNEADESEEEREHEEEHEGEYSHVRGCHKHEIGGESVKGALLHALVHTLTILGFMLAVNLIVGVIIYFVGEDGLTAFLARASLLQPLFSAIVGLIPSCAGSVAIARLYGMGALSLGGAVAGLSAGAGLGYSVLFKNNKNVKQNVAIVAICFTVSVVAGTIINLIAGA